MTDQELLKSIIRGWCDDAIVQDKGLAAVNRLVQSPPISIKVHNNIIELSSGHVFVLGSVKTIGPLIGEGWNYYGFELAGVGFKTFISEKGHFHLSGPEDSAMKLRASLLRDEAIRKLIPVNG